MKTLSFSAVEILPSLLNKSKTQTIRLRKYGNIKHFDKDREKYFNPPPRFKVGEEVQLMWKQRSKWIKFCKVCGSHITGYRGVALWCSNKQCVTYEKELKMFHKLLGKVKITEVFEIEMKSTNGFGTILHKKEDGWYAWFPNLINNLAKRDGFESAEELFRWFDKQYNLSSPKQFYVYRWAFAKANELFEEDDLYSMIREEK